MAVLSAGAIAALANANKKGKAVKFQKVQNGQVYALQDDGEAKARPPPPAKKPKAPSVPANKQAAPPVDPNDPDNKPAPQFHIVSSDPANWRFNVGAFHPQQRIPNPDNPDEVIVPSIQIQDFHQPIKMNRKQPKSMLYAEPEPTEIKDQQFKPMLGPDGKPVYHNGQVVMVNSEGQTLASLAKAKERANAAAAAANAKGKGKATDAPGKGKKSQPKTRQVFIQSDDVRARRKEEYHPWVMEDTSGDQKWIGTMNDRNDDSLWGLLKVSGGCFEFIPIHRFYTFKPQSQIVANVRADDIEKQATSKKPDFSQVYKARMGNASSSDVVARLERHEKKEQKQAMRRPPKQEDDLFMDDGGVDIDEFEYEKEASDDEEGHRPEEIAEDEDEKDSKERLKREYLVDTNVGRQTESDDEAEELDQMLMKALKKSGEMDEDDDEDDVYGSKYGVKKEEDEDTPMAMATGIQQQAPKPKVPTPTPPVKPPVAGASGSSSNAMEVDSSVTTSPVKASGSLMDFTPTAPRVNSRGGSPAASAGVGAALLAKRATSPKPTGPGRGGSPQAGRAGSPLAGNIARAASPVAPAAAAAAVAPANAATADAKKNKKRKEAPGAADATRSPTTAAPGGGIAKKKKLDEAARPEPPSLKNVVEVLKASGGVGGYVSAKTLASHYQTKHNPEYKKNLIQLLKQVANITQDADGVQRIQLKPEYV